MSSKTKKPSTLQSLKTHYQKYTAMNNRNIPSNLKQLKTIVNKELAVDYINSYMNRTITSKKEFCRDKCIGIERLNKGLKELSFVINKKNTNSKSKQEYIDINKSKQESLELSKKINNKKGGYNVSEIINDPNKF